VEEIAAGAPIVAYELVVAALGELLLVARSKRAVVVAHVQVLVEYVEPALESTGLIFYEIKIIMRQDVLVRFASRRRASKGVLLCAKALCRHGLAGEVPTQTSFQNPIALLISTHLQVCETDPRRFPLGGGGREADVQGVRYDEGEDNDGNEEPPHYFLLLYYVDG